MVTIDSVLETETDVLSHENSRELRILRLGRRSYGEVWNLQKALVIKRKKQLVPDTLILVEHNPVYTLGKNAKKDHLLQSRRPHVPVYHIERGGDVTYHGPGQLVGYPILDLHDHRLSVSWYMRNLEKVIITTLAHFDIAAHRRDGLTGVWIRDEKIAALGVRLSRWISMHGFAINVNVDLSYFDDIIPCGIFEYGVTSMERILGHQQIFKDVEEVVIGMFVKMFEFSKP